MEILEKFERSAKIQALKYVISKQMFCPYSGEMLDYRKAIMVEAEGKGISDTKVLSLRFKDKVEEIKALATKKGLKVSIFINE